MKKTTATNNTCCIQTDLEEHSKGTNSIRFRVPCVPVAQPRQRHRVITNGGRSFATNYTPKNDPVNAFKAACQLAASNVYRDAPLDCPVMVDLTFIFPRPKSVPKRLGTGRLPHTCKPDRDNLAKSFFDALNGLLYRDDSLVFDGFYPKGKGC
jgi:Holliday junction resolvase RusA-like endonuclease